jgi:predicted dehydrogenase
MKNINRRAFIQKTSLATAAVGMIGTTACQEDNQTRPAQGAYLGDFAAPKLRTIRAAFIGVGHRGKGHVRNFARLENTQVVAISDLYQDNVDKAADIAQEAKPGQHEGIARYAGDENLWKKMLTEVQPDVVFISTNWANHAPMAIAALQAGAHAFVEVPLALTLDELWAIVDASEKAQLHCMMMENVNYSRDELLFLNMCRQGL